VGVETRSPARGCDPKLAHRETCGYIGINAEQCAEKACCWDDSSGYAPTKCYLPNSGQSLDRWPLRFLGKKP